MKTSKKVYIILVIIVSILIVSIGYNSKSNTISYNKDVIYQGTYSMPENLNQLEENSKIIVKGIYTGERVTDNDTSLIGPSSISKFEVEEIYKGNIKNDLISVVEPCEFVNGSYYNIDGYVPMKQGDTYMLYLKEINTSSGPEYTIVSGNFGKYNLTNSTKLLPYTEVINNFNQISDLDMITTSIKKCSIYNSIRSEITNETYEESSSEPKPLTKEESYYNFRIKPSDHVTYYIDNQSASQYPNHIKAYQNAIQKIEQLPSTNISFSKVDTDTNSIIELTSVNSPKEEWLGIAKINYVNSTPYNTVSKSTVYINEYNIISYKLAKEHIYEVALHEVLHSFGLLHQEQVFVDQTIMAPYLSIKNKGRIDLSPLDRNNLSYGYPINNDWEKHWAKSQISEFMTLGYVNGYSDGSFLPDFPITRAEFVVVFNRVFGLTEYSGKVFEDTKNHWAKEGIDIAVTNGVANGVSVSQFRPDDCITREQAAVMIANYKKLNSTSYNKVAAYKDYKDVSTWAVGAIESVVDAGYMKGYEDNTFRPKGNITRAEAVVTMSRIK